MPPEDDWQQIQSDLSSLLGNNATVPFHPLLGKMLQWSSAEPKPYPPEIFEAIIELIQKMSIDVKGGRSIHEVLDQARAGTYVQPDWKAHSVYQANGHIFQFILDDLHSHIEPDEPEPSFPVPIVLVVMDRTEAENLDSGLAFRGYPVELHTDFEQLRKLLLHNGVADWVQRYHATPEAWQPFNSAKSAENIAQLANQAFGMIQGYRQQFVPLFKDIRTLNDASNRYLLRELRHNGCVVVIDSISMRHPAIQRAFQQSALDVYPNTSVVTIAPIHSVFEIVRQMTIVVQLHISDMEFAKRRSDFHEEFGVCIETYDKQEFQHWLVGRVRKMYPSEVAAQTGVRARMFKNMSGVS